MRNIGVNFLIAHAPWAPGRAQLRARLRGRSLKGESVEPRAPDHAAFGARRLGNGAADSPRHVCLLNDDVVLADDTVDRIMRAVAAQPDEPISLHCNNPNVLA